MVSIFINLEISLKDARQLGHILILKVDYMADLLMKRETDIMEILVMLQLELMELQKLKLKMLLSLCLERIPSLVDPLSFMLMLMILEKVVTNSLLPQEMLEVDLHAVLLVSQVLSDTDTELKK